MFICSDLVAVTKTWKDTGSIWAERKTILLVPAFVWPTRTIISLIFYSCKLSRNLYFQCALLCCRLYTPTHICWCFYCDLLTEWCWSCDLNQAELTVVLLVPVVISIKVSHSPLAWLIKWFLQPSSLLWTGDVIRMSLRRAKKMPHKCFANSSPESKDVSVAAGVAQADSSS